MRLKQICAKEVKSTEGITWPKDFNTRAHLKCNKILVDDDQTNNDEISETVFFPFYFLFTI